MNLPFTEEQLDKMSRGDIISLMETMWEHHQKQETRAQILEKKTKEPGFLNAMLSDRLTLAQREQFGPSNEKCADGHTQLNLFNEAEQEAGSDVPEPGVEEIYSSSYERKKRSGRREEDLSALETTEVIGHKPTGANRSCPDCNIKYRVVTKETVRRLKLIPTWFEMVRGVTYVYNCPKCGTMECPEKVSSLLKGSMVTSSPVVGIMNAEHMSGMPLTRQERGFVCYDLNLFTKTMANWIIQCTDRYLQPLYELIREEFLRNRYAHEDEARVQVIDESEQKGPTQNWTWICLTGEYNGSSRMILFQYERTRAGYHPAELLGGQFQGYFTYDGYQVYHSLPERVAMTGRMAHMRHRFDESVTTLKEDFTKEQLKEITAYQTMARIGMFYKIEEMIHDRSPEERYEERQRQVRLLLEAFFEWLHTPEEAVDRSSEIGEAVLYTLNQEAYLKRYLEDDHLSVDNLAAERALKNLVTGRYNWLSAKSIRGAQASVTACGIIGAALLNGLRPYNYFTCVMRKMRDFGVLPTKEEMLELPLWPSNLPDDCRNRLRK